MTVLCPSERFEERRGRRAHTMVERAWQMIQLVVRWWPGREVVCVADTSDAVLAWLDHVNKLPRASGLTRLRLDAALDAPPPRREPRQHGRPRLPGKRRATMEAALTDDETPWTTRAVEPWDGAGPRAVDVCTDTAVWYHAGKPPVPLRRVLVRDPKGTFKPQALLSTNPDQTPEHMLTWCVRRWTIEVTCKDARAHLGMETQRPWNERAIGRTTPVASLHAIIPLAAHRRDRTRGPPVSEARRGLPKHAQRLPIRSRWSGDTCGITLMFQRPNRTLTCVTFHMHGWRVSHRRAAMPHEWIKSSSGTGR